MLRIMYSAVNAFLLVVLLFYFDRTFSSLLLLYMSLCSVLFNMQPVSTPAVKLWLM